MMVNKYHIILSCIVLIILGVLGYVSIQFGYLDQIPHEKRGTCLINSSYKYDECSAKCYIHVNYTLIETIPNGTIRLCNRSNCSIVEKFDIIKVATVDNWIYVNTESYFWGWYSPGTEKLCWYDDRDIFGTLTLIRLNLGFYGLCGACFISLMFLADIGLIIFLVGKLRYQQGYNLIQI